MQQKNKAFTALQIIWYEKLKQKGFVDIEESTSDNLKSWASRYALKDPTRFEAHQTYYVLAGQFLHSYDFPNAHKRRIWALHSEGKTVRQISILLRKKGYASSGKSNIDNIIRTLEIAMFDAVRMENQND